ncbi:glycosyltransferase [Microbacterium sp. 2P01SA-2]|uniref:glycosyltransferase n=1 Tax=unclassified Microbacterium TaxID=2609290 RepID=UPI0039A1F2FC
MLLLGRIEPYKGVFDLIDAARSVRAPGAEVRIVGAARPEMRDRIASMVDARTDGGARVTYDLRAVSDEEMVREITEAEVVALPYRDAGNGNSGVALVALSLNRPVLVYRSCIMEELADGVGREWVHMMDRPIAGECIDDVLSGGGHHMGEQPNMTGRNWSAIASAYANVFRKVLRR